MPFKGRFLRGIIAGVCVFAAIGTFLVLGLSRNRAKEPSPISGEKESGQFQQPRTLSELVNLNPGQLAQVDIGLMNLLCAQGLPGAEDMKVNDYLTTLDRWAQHVKSETTRNFHHFRENPAYYYNSEAFYKMLMMAVVVYEDFHIRYNPKWMAPQSEVRSDDHFFADSRDIFIHGLVESQRMGTCSSMPVFYIALGRRLGYPLKLVTTRQHLFMRWDSPGEKFDMDATGKGLDRYDDDYYKKWPFPITEQEIQDEGYLKSLSTREELSVFLFSRGACLAENGWLGQATQSYQIACLLAPNWKGNQVMLAHAQQRPIGLVVQQQPFNPGSQQQGANPKIPADSSPFHRIQNPKRTP